MVCEGGAGALSGAAPAAAAPAPGPGKRSHAVRTGVKVAALVATGRPGGVAIVPLALLPVVFGGSLRLHGLCCVVLACAGCGDCYILGGELDFFG